MHAEGAKVILGFDKPAYRLRAMGEHLHIQRRRPVGYGIEQPDVRTALVNDASAVGLCVAGVKRVVVGMPASITAIRSARVEVGHALEVRQEEHAVAHPHRAGDVAGQLVHTPELSVAFGIDPQMPGRAALVALPARRIGGVAPDDLGSSRMQREMIDLTVRNELGHATGRIERVRAVVAKERLAIGRDEQDVPVRRPAAHHGVRSEPGHPTGEPSAARHQIHLGMLFIATDKRNVLAIGRLARRGWLGQPRSQPSCDASRAGDLPDVVVGDEDDVVTPNAGVAKVCGVVHRSSVSRVAAFKPLMAVRHLRAKGADYAGSWTRRGLHPAGGQPMTRMFTARNSRFAATVASQSAHPPTLGGSLISASGQNGGNPPSAAADCSGAAAGSLGQPDSWLIAALCQTVGACQC
jgi:hypothetical protein